MLRRVVPLVLGWVGLATALAALTALSSACGSSGLLAPVPDSATEITLYDFRTSDLTSPSAFDILAGSAIRTDITSGWDFLYYVTANGTMQLRPRDMVLSDQPASGQGIQKVSDSFEQLTEAPADGYVTDKAVAISVGDVLAVVSRTNPGYSVRCRYFMKMEILSADAAAGTMTFRYLSNPNCEQRILAPGQGGN
jgi:hypothetical protein